jgi:mRNA-degrading endonuclease toxin of MazEF toxin-antitoxin module
VTYRRGDVVWVGVEKFAEGGAKDRPVVILSSWPCNGSFDCLVCICSSSKITDPYYTTLMASDFETGGLPGEGLIRPSYMTVVVQNETRRLAGRLKADKIARVLSTLREVLS